MMMMIKLNIKCLILLQTIKSEDTHKRPDDGGRPNGGAVRYNHLLEIIKPLTKTI